MPTLLSFGLQIINEEIKDIEFGIVAIYSCSKSCSGEGYQKEFAFVQPAI